MADGLQDRGDALEARTGITAPVIVAFVVRSRRPIVWTIIVAWNVAGICRASA
jgi:hypothetical protein